MSDEKTPQQIISEKEAAKADEFKKLAGKTFRKKGSVNGLVKVICYAGIKVRQVRDTVERSHSLTVESYGARWNPPAFEFLNDYEEVQVEENVTNQLQEAK